MPKTHLSSTRKFFLAIGCAAAVTFGAFKKQPDTISLSAMPAASAQSFHNEKRTAELVRRLKDNEAWVRRNAAQALGNAGDPTALPALGDALRDKEWEVREKAAEAIGLIAGKRQDGMDVTEAGKALESALSDRNDRVREGAARALGKLGASSAVKSLAGKFRDPRPGVRCGAAWALGAIGDVDSAPALLNALGDPSWAVRKEAAWALGTIGEKNRGSAMVAASAPSLVKALDDHDPRVQEAAAWALGRLGAGAAAAPHLVRALRSYEPGVLREAAVSLGIVGEPTAIPHLMRLVMYGNRDLRVDAVTAVGNIAERHPGNAEVTKAVLPFIEMLGYESPAVGMALVAALGKTGDARAIPSLLIPARDRNADATFRANAISALGMALRLASLNSLAAGTDAIAKKSMEQALSAIIGALRDTEEAVRKAAAVALGKMDDSAAAGLLAKAARDVSSGIRREAIVALGNIGERNQGSRKMADEALPALLEVLRTAELRAEAVEALGKLGDRRALPALRKISAESNGIIRAKAEKAIAAVSKKKQKDSLDDLSRDFRTAPKKRPTTSIDDITGDFKK